MVREVRLNATVAGQQVNRERLVTAVLLVKALGGGWDSASLAAVGVKPAVQHLSEFLGSGACVFDFDGDGRPDIFLVDADGKGGGGAVIEAIASRSA